MSCRNPRCDYEDCDGIENCPNCGENMSCGETKCPHCYNPADHEDD